MLPEHATEIRIEKDLNLSLIHSSSRVHAFGFRILGYDPVYKEIAGMDYIQMTDFGTRLEESDAISVQDVYKRQGPWERDTSVSPMRPAWTLSKRG